MKVITTANNLISKLDDGGKTIKYLNINQVFVDKDGKIADDVMNDQLHPTLNGYHLWADAMRPTLAEMMK
jgi:beta-glucosidase